MKYKNKYLKYKSKYLNLKKKYGGLQKENENLELPETPPQSPPHSHHPSPIGIISSFVEDFFNFTGISLMGLLGNPTTTSEPSTSEPSTSEPSTSEPPTLEPPTLEPPTPPDSDDEKPEPFENAFENA